MCDKILKLNLFKSIQPLVLKEKGLINKSKLVDHKTNNSDLYLPL